MKFNIEYKTIILSLLACFAISSTAFAKRFQVENLAEICLAPSLQDDAAIDLATSDLSAALKDLYHLSPKVKTLGEWKSVSRNSIVLLKTDDAELLEQIQERTDLQIPPLREEGFLIQTLSNRRKPIILIVGNGELGVCYGVFHLIERCRMNRSFTDEKLHIQKEPDMTWRMITQPFEALGYPEVAKLEKPIHQKIPREFDPQRPWEGVGYDPEDEAKNILRMGMNAMWVGNFSFSTDYQGYDPSIFPAGSEGLKWVRKRQEKIDDLMAAARKYHLKTIANSDIFIYPKGQDASRKWEMLEYSLNEFLTRYPDIDRISTRFGENYSYFNSYFVGAPLEGKVIEEGFPKIIDFIYEIVHNKYGKTYVPRTWACGNHTWGSDLEHYNHVMDQVEPREGLILSVKNTRTDFWRYNKFNPIIGEGKHEQAIEYLCQDGYHFKNSFPYYDVIRMSHGASELGEDKGMKYAYQTGARTVWGWLSADGWCGPYSKHEEWLRANIYGFTQLAWDVDRDPRELAQEWASLEFGVPVDSRVALNLADIMMLSEPMMIKLRYFKNHCLRHEGWLPASNWMRDELIGGGTRSHNRLSKGKSFAPGGIRGIFNPKTIEEDIAEKIEAEEIMNSMVEKFKAIKSEIPDQVKAEELYNTLLYGKYFVRTIRYYISGMFRYYNGEYNQAASLLRKWKITWDYYNNEISRLPGIASLILDGGMVDTCNEAMKEMNQTF